MLRDVVTGGDSIAVLWNPATGTSPKSYTVYRNNIVTATVAPPPAPNAYNTRITTTARYIDTNVVAGQTYQYKVTMTATDNTVSGFSGTLSATHPLAANTTPVPVVTVSTTNAAYTATLTEGASLIRTWYPKIADRLTRRSADQGSGPDYLPPSTITLTHSADANGYAVTSGTTITFKDDSLDDALETPDPAFHAAYLAAYLHEATHVLQAYPGRIGAGWLAEGLAVWATHQIFNDAEILTPAFTPIEYYTRGYEQGARFLQWLTSGSGVPWTSSAYTRARLVHDANVAANSGTFTSAFFLDRTGQRPGPLWSQMANIWTATDQRVLPADSGTLCLDDQLLKSDDNNPLQLGTCWSTDAQLVSSVPISSGSNVYRLVIMGKCMDVKGGGTPAEGTAVVIYTCTEGADWQYWRFDSDGTLRQNRSNLCVQPTGGVLANGIALEIRTCTSQAFRWTRQVL